MNRKLTFKELKESVYQQYTTSFDEEEKRILDASDVDELIDILNELGFDMIHAYNFILDSLVDLEDNFKKATATKIIKAAQKLAESCGDVYVDLEN